MKAALSDLMKEKIRQDQLSYREAAKKIGVAHTTVMRVIDGETTDINTLVKICNWLGVSPSHVLDAETHGTGALGARMAMVLETNPELMKVFQEALDRLDRGEIEQSTLNDIVNYATWRLLISSKKDEEPNEDQQLSGEWSI